MVILQCYVLFGSSIGYAYGGGVTLMEEEDKDNQVIYLISAILSLLTLCYTKFRVCDRQSLIDYHKGEQKPSGSYTVDFLLTILFHIIEVVDRVGGFIILAYLIGGFAVPIFLFFWWERYMYRRQACSVGKLSYLFFN